MLNICPDWFEGFVQYSQTRLGRPAIKTLTALFLMINFLCDTWTQLQPWWRVDGGNRCGRLRQVCQHGHRLGIIWSHMGSYDLHHAVIRVYHSCMTHWYIYNYIYTCVSSSRTGSADISPWKQWNFSSPGAAGARRNPIFRRETPMVSG